jgi:hypothetical protein
MSEEWISVNERLPPPYIFMLVAVKESDGWGIYKGFMESGGHWNVGVCRYRPNEHDHTIFWMELPPPPKEGE